VVQVDDAATTLHKPEPSDTATTMRRSSDRAPAAGAPRLKTRVGMGQEAAASPAVQPSPAPPAVVVDPRVEEARAFVEACRSELAKERDKLRQGRLHYEIARLLENPIGDLTGAAEQFQRANTLLPDHVPTMQGARRALVAQKSYQAALPLFAAEVRLTADPKHKAQLLYQKGRLLEDQMAQKREAGEAFAAALELDKSNPTLLKSVERAEIAEGAWDALDRTYEREAAAVTRDVRHRAAVIVERARLLELHRGDPRSAAELYQAALDLDPQAPGALNALKRLHYGQQRWRDLAQVLQREAEQASDPTVRAMALYRIGRVQADRLGNLEGGVDAMERASREAPEDPMVLEELARLYELGKRWQPLVGALERLVGRVQSAGARVGLMHRIGQLFEERLEDEAQAITWYSRALEQDPGFLPALQALGSLYTRQQQWLPLVGMHLAEAEHTQDAERRAAAHARVAGIQELQLGNVDEAVQHHARALGLVPLYPPSFKALSRLYSAAGRFRELGELYERAVDGAPDAETKITYLFKIGRIKEDALDAPGQAVAAYRRILDIDHAHLGAVHAMQRAAERGGRWKELVTALELETELVKDPQAVAALLHRAGEVYEEHLEDRDAALVRYRKVIERTPKYVPALASLGRLYFKAGRWDELLDVYRRELDAAPRGPEAAALLYKMGELSEERIGNDDQAVKFYREAIELDPFHTPALHALGRKLAERGQWGELVKLLELELSGLKDSDLRARTAFRMGEVYENRLLQPDKALAAYEQTLAAAEDFRPALDGRARLLSQARDYKRMVEELEREANSARDPSMAIAALLRQGELWRFELEDRRRAMQCFEAVLERDPAHLGALLELESLYSELGAWEKLAGVYTTESRVLADPGARIAALRELARLQETKELVTSEQLRQTYFAILQLDPVDLGALIALERVALASRDTQLLSHVDAKLGAAVEDAGLVSAHHTRLAESLEAAGDASALDVYRAALARDAENLAATRGLSRIAMRSRDAALLEEAAEREARVSRDTDAAARLLVRGAGLRAGQGDSDGAARALERALELNPEHEPAAQQLEQMLLGAGQVDRLLDTLMMAAQSATGDRMPALWGSVATLLADRKDDVPAALAALHRVIEHAPGHLATLLKLAELYARDSQWAEAVDRLRQVLAQSPPREVVIEAQLRLASILDEHLGDPARAVASLNAVLSIDDGNRASLKQLLDIQMRRGQTEAAAGTAAKLVGVSADINERADALSHLASLERERKQYGAAAKAYEQAVTMVGQGGEVALQFRAMLDEQKQRGDQPEWPRYVAALTRFLDQTSLPGEKKSPTYLEIARVLGDEMGMADKSLATLQRGLADAPDDVPLRTELATRLKAAGHMQQAVQELRKLLGVDVMRVETWRDLSGALSGMQREREAQLALAPLVALGVANDLEQSTVASHPPRPASAQPGSFDDVAFRHVDAAGLPDAASELLKTLVEGLGRIHAPELERYGLSTRDRISSRSGHPLRMLADRVAQCFGVADYDLYLHRAHSGSLEVEFTDPPGILVPAHVTNLAEAQQVFLLARPLANVARGIHVVDKLAPQAVGILLTAAARSAQPGFGAGLTDEDFLDAHSRRVVKAMSRRGRRAMEEAAAVYAAAPVKDIADWCAKVRLSASRAALMLSDDLPGDITLLRRTEGDLAGLSGAALAQGMEVVRDLLRFWVSDPAFTLRRKLGMA
jgi:tetratricopeptide (TPR) repeat protein